GGVAVPVAPDDRERAPPGVRRPQHRLAGGRLLSTGRGAVGGGARGQLERSVLGVQQGGLAVGAGGQVVAVRQGQRGGRRPGRGAVALTGGGGQRVHPAGLDGQRELPAGRGDVWLPDEPLGRAVGVEVEVARPHVHGL